MEYLRKSAKSKMLGTAKKRRLRARKPMATRIRASKFNCARLAELSYDDALKALIDAIKNDTRQLSSGDQYEVSKKCRIVLVRSGIINKKGELKAPYADR